MHTQSKIHRKVLTWVVIVSAIAGLLYLAHNLNLVEMVRKAHGG